MLNRFKTLWMKWEIKLLKMLKTITHLSRHRKIMSQRLIPIEATLISLENHKMKIQPGKKQNLTTCRLWVRVSLFRITKLWLLSDQSISKMRNKPNQLEVHFRKIIQLISKSAPSYSSIRKSKTTS